MSDEPLTPPVIGITMGDAAGIGPEVVLRSLLSKANTTEQRCVVIGDAECLRRVSKNIGGPDIAGFDPANAAPGSAVEVYDLANLPDDFEIGVDAAVTGKASAEYITTAVDLWKRGVIDAVSTAPISKKAIALGGYDYPGHTEFLAELTGTSKFAMSFFAGKLRVVLLSTHLPLLAAIGLVKKDKLSDLIRFTDRELGRLLGKKASIAVAGLNPHASEGGLFGTEEEREIEPAIKQCRLDGIDVNGPYSPDTIFVRCFNGDFDGCVALYHDQATIAVKSISFGSGVNVTLGLPLIRTSVDHGTAYDIAGKGIADASSMSAAIALAGELVHRSRSGGKV